MAKAEEKPGSDYSKFDSLSTTVLEAILRADFDAPEAEQLEAEEALYIAGLLAKRRNVKHKDVEESMAEFFEYYYPVAQQGESLYTFAEEAEREAGETRARRQAKVEVLPRKNWRRLASVAAVLVLMIFSSTVTAYALGYDPLAALTGWNREQTGEVVTAELIELLAEYDASDLVPKWLPEGYAFDRFDNDMIGNRLGISAFFTAAGDKKMSINYTSWYNNEGVLSGGMSMNVESIQGLYESGFGDIAVYSTNNVDYYILGTDERRTVAWKNSVWGCTIVGNFSKDEAVKIINSIYE